MNKHQIGFALSYFSPKYIRGLTLWRALNSFPALLLHDARNTTASLFRYLQTLTKVIRINQKVKPPTWIVSFRGHEIYWLVRAIVGKKARIIFDEFVSPYDSFLNERKTFKANSLIARILYQIEKSILYNSDLLMTDTPSQAKHYADLFDLDPTIFSIINITADEDIFNPQAQAKDLGFQGTFVVFTYATFLPLHGMEIILKAAALLKDKPIQFIIAGGKGKELTAFKNQIHELGLSSIKHIPWINFEELPGYIRGSSLCLGGPFGNTGQANRVVTGKTMQFLACAAPTIVGVNEETRSFSDQVDCLLVPQGDPDALARSISWAYDHPDQLKQIGERGRILYERCFSMEVLKNGLKKLLEPIATELESAGKR